MFVNNLLLSQATERIVPIDVYDMTSGGMGVWYDIQDLSTLFQDVSMTVPAVVDSKVAAIYDKSGNGVHATASASANQPYLRKDSNGFYYLDFNAVSGSMSISNLGQLADNTSVVEIFAYVSTSNVSNQFIIGHGGTSGRARLIYLDGFNIGGTGGNWFIPGDYIISDPYIWSFYQQYGKQEIRNRGLVVGEGSNTYSTGSSSNNFATSGIILYEFFLYERPDNIDRRINSEVYLFNRYKKNEVALYQKNKKAFPGNENNSVWYDIQDLSTLFQDSAGTVTAAVGQSVGKILDKGTAGIDLIQTTEAQKPILRQDSEGFYYLEFDGTDDYLVSSENYLLNSPDANMSLHGILKVVDTSTSYDCFFAFGTNSSSQARRFNVSANSYAQYDINGSAYTSSCPLKYRNRNSYHFYKNSTTGSIGVYGNKNQYRAKYATPSENTQPGLIYLGQSDNLGSHFFNGFVYEIIMYEDFEVNKFDRIDNFLYQKYKIQSPELFFQKTEPKERTQVNVSGGECVLFKTKDGYYAVGSNANGVYGTNDTNNQEIGFRAYQPDIKKIKTTGYNSAYLTKSGDFFIWGENSGGVLGDGTTVDKQVSQKVETWYDSDGTTPVSSQKIVDFNLNNKDGGSEQNCCLLSEDGNLFVCGYNYNGALSGTDNPITQYRKILPPSTGHTPIKKFTSVFNQTFFIDINNDCYSVGTNSGGQLGVGDTSRRTTPTKIVGLDGNVSEVFCSDYRTSDNSYISTFFITLDNNLYSTGTNTVGQLGVGDTSTRTTPTLVLSDINKFWVGCGRGSPIAQKNDGTLWGWGYNYRGQLGIGSSGYLTSPIQLVALESLVASNGEIKDIWHSGVEGNITIFVLFDNGKVFGAGYNGSGELGQGNTTVQTSWVEILFDQKIIDIFTLSNIGYYVTAYFKGKDKSIYCCGYNPYNNKLVNSTPDNTPARIQPY